MEWFSENWVWIVVTVAFVVMHLFGHGGHGGGRRDDGDRNARKDDEPAAPRGGHRH